MTIWKRCLAIGAMAMAACGYAAAAEVAPHATVHTSPAGFTFRHVQLPGEKYQVVSFAWKDGSAVARAGKEGLVSLATALMMQGPKGLGRSEMEEDLKDLDAGIVLNSATNITSGVIGAPPANFGKAAAILAGILTDPALPADTLAQLQKSRAANARQQAEDAGTLAGQLLARLIVDAGPHQNYLIGDQSAFENVSMADIEAWRRDVIVRDTLILVTAGPMTPVESGREIDAMFAGLPQSGRVPEPAKPAFRSPGKLIVLERPTAQTAIIAGGPMNFTVTPDELRFDIAAAVLGGGSSGRLFSAVRERLGATYGISASLYDVDIGTRALLIRTAVANEKAADVLAAIRAEYSRYVAEGVTDDEIEPLKTQLVTGVHENTRRALGLANKLLAQDVLGYPEDYLSTFEARVRGYDRAAINEDIRSKFPRAPLTFVMVTPSAEGLNADCVIRSPEELVRCQ
jgi:zinc protease